MSKFDLRDISERLTRSRDTEAVVFEFLSYLQSMHSDWRAALTFYEVSQDALVNRYECQDRRLVKGDATIPVDQLPARLVRKFFHPSAFFNPVERRPLLSHLFQTSPAYEPDLAEAPLLRNVTPITNWQSCAVLALAHQEDIIGLLILVSTKRNAFNNQVIGEVVPLKSIAALALAQHLDRARGHAGEGDDRSAKVAAAEFQERIRRLNAQTQELTEDNRAKTEKLEALGREVELLDKNSSESKQELERVKTTLFALEEQTEVATQHLTDAYSELSATQSRLQALEQTVTFLKDMFQVVREAHEPQELSSTLVTSLCDNFGIERCSLMVLDPASGTLQIAAHYGIDPEVAARVKVRVGQGIAGWVAHHRKPLFVRVREDASEAPHTGQDTYNSDSFIAVPVLFNEQVCGVLNLSNKRDGEPFDTLDLDRATMAAALLATTLGGHEQDHDMAAAA